MIAQRSPYLIMWLKTVEEPELMAHIFVPLITVHAVEKSIHSIFPFGITERKNGLTPHLYFGTVEA